MKRLSFRLLIVPALAMIFFSCDRQNLTPAPVIEPPMVQLNYDGDNLTAPLLPAGIYEAGVRFTPPELIGLDGKTLSQVILYMQDIPVAATIRVFEGSTNGAPETLLSSQGIRSDLEAFNWNQIFLTSPTEIDADKDLWITFRFELGQESQTLGCDPGPANENGDYLFENTDNLWQKLSVRTGGGIDINWNLRAVVE